MDEHVSQIAIAAIAGVVVIVALWLGRKLVFKRDDKGTSFEVGQEPGGEREAGVTVGNKAELRHVKAGDVSGIKASGPGAAATAERVDVLNEAKVEDAQLG